MRGLRIVCHVSVFVVVLGAAAGPSFAALPRTYEVQRVDSPAPTEAGNFGRALATVGDVNGDGKDDMLVGNDKHGRRTGQVFVISGANGSLIRQLQLPDNDTVGSDRRSGFGAAVGKIGFNRSAGGGAFYDIGSCPSGDGADPDAYCDNNPVGAADGVPDLLVTASGVDVNPASGAIDPSLNNDLGVAYVFDGASGALLKKLLMPAVDRQMEVNLQATIGTDARYGRAALSPGGLFPCSGNAGISTCPSVPDAVRGGDINGGGKADIVVAATDFDETGANSQPTSPCASAGLATTCPNAGRVYVFHGETIAGTNPAVVDETPDLTIADRFSKPDGGSRVGSVLIPVGDLGRCTTAPAPVPGSSCANPTRTSDGKADFVMTGPDYDAEFNGAGTAFLVDGSTGAVLRQFDHPEPQPSSAMGLIQNGLIQPAFGDIGQTSVWDFYVPSVQQNVGGGTVGRGYAFNGDLNARERFVPFAQLNDPTPNPSGNFGGSAAGVGNVDEASPQNELLIGAIGPHAPGTNRDVVNDVHFFSAITEKALQSIPAPDQQPGAGFGEGLAPLGDLNGDGFLDFAVGGGAYNLTTTSGTCASTCLAAGRIYIFRSDNSPAPPTPSPSGPPAGPQGPAGPSGPGSSSAAATAGRTLELASSAERLPAGRKLKLRGALEAFANKAGCESKQQTLLQRRPVKSARYTTFARITTDSRGSFSRSFTPSTTSVYRALVEQSASCAGAASNRAKVTIVPKKKRKR